MIDWLILLILIEEVFILTKLDKIIYGTWITPFSLLAFPYTVVVITAVLFAPALGFISLYVESVLIWIVGLLLFWLGGLMIALPLGKTIRAKAKMNQPFLYEKESQKLVLMLAWITIPVMVYGLFVSLRSLGLQEVGTDEFAKSYGYGFVGHIKAFSFGLTVYLIGTAHRNNIFGLFTILILIVLYMMYPVKSWVIIPVLAGFIYRVSSGRLKLSIFKITLPLLLCYVFFNVAYLIGFGAKNPETFYNIEAYEQLLTHFIFYVFGGVLALGNVSQTGVTNLCGDPHVIFAPFVNLYAFISSGDMISSVTEHFSVISIYSAKASVVHTFFGTILINLGCFYGIVYVVFLGVFVYGLFAIAKVTRNCWSVVLWSFIAAMLFLGWFDFYFKQLSFVEVPAYCAVLAFLFWLVVQRYEKRRDPEKSLILNPRES